MINNKRPKKIAKVGKIYATKINVYLDPVTMEPMPEYVMVTDKKKIEDNRDVLIFHYVSDLEKHPLALEEKSFFRQFQESW